MSLQKMFQCKKKQLCIAIPIKKHCHITSGTVDERQLARKVKYSMASSPVGCCHNGQFHLQLIYCLKQLKAGLLWLAIVFILFSKMLGKLE